MLPPIGIGGSLRTAESNGIVSLKSIEIHEVNSSLPVPTILFVQMYYVLKFEPSCGHETVASCFDNIMSTTLPTHIQDLVATLCSFNGHFLFCLPQQCCWPCLIDTTL